ncbi:MAG: ribbon-helix-helix protein, CopG family, partial [Armatimonadota bacterium]
MRTTLSLETDVAALLERIRRERKLSLKALVNEALRQGLKQLTEPPARPTTYQTPT